MKAKELKKLLKEKTPRQIITDHMECKIFLSQRQLQQVIDKKEGVDKGRGSCMVGMRQKNG